MSKAVSQAWKRIEQWLSQNTPQLLKNLQAGATENAIEQAEEQLEVYLPEDVKASYRIHNGQIHGSVGFVDGCCFLSLDEMLNQWSCQMELDEDIEGEWHPLWVPIAYDYRGNYYCLDLDPNLDTAVGRIICVFYERVPQVESLYPDTEIEQIRIISHETVINAEKVVADSFQDFLTQFADVLENGKYVFSEEEKMLVECNDG